MHYINLLTYFTYYMAASSSHDYDKKASYHYQITCPLVH